MILYFQWRKPVLKVLSMRKQLKHYEVAQAIGICTLKIA